MSESSSSLTAAALPSRPMAYGALALSMTLVGCYVALSKPLVAVFPVFLLAWLRFGIGGVAMVGWLRRPPDEPPQTGRTRLLLFLEAFIGNFLFTLLVMAGMHLSSAVSASVIMACIPAVVALLGRVFLGERLTPRILASIVCAVAGVSLLALSRPHGAAAAAIPAADKAWLGQLLLMGAVCCEAAYSVIGKCLTSSLSARRITSIVNLWGLVLATPLGLYAASRFGFAAVSWQLWALLVFYALAACVWSISLWMTGLRVVPASQAGVFTVFLPAGTALTGVLVLGERLAGMQLLALGLAVAGVLIATSPLPGRRMDRQGGDIST